MSGSRTVIVTPKDPHHINFDDMYPRWGLACRGGDEEKDVGDALDLREASAKQRQEACALASELLDLTEFTLASCASVPHFQGEDLNHPPICATLVRYTRTGEMELGGEHISLTIDTENRRLLGLTRMLSECDAQNPVDPNTALASAVAFLQQNAADLVSTQAAPDLRLPDGLAPGQGVDLNLSRDEGEGGVGISLGEVNALWIDGHTEKCGDGETHGMKVKMVFTDESERYAWAIIDKQGEVQVFERNVFWNFAKLQRETQMWLHDGWLMQHGLTLPPLGSVPEGSPLAQPDDNQAVKKGCFIL